MLKFTTIDRILGNFSRNVGEDVSEESLISWIGEASEFILSDKMYEPSVVFLKVENHSATLPDNIKKIEQVARDNRPIEKETPIQDSDLMCEVKEEVKTCCKKIECCCDKEPEFTITYDPEYGMKWSFQTWIQTAMYKKFFTPVRLSQHSFFRDMASDSGPYETVQDEYSIIGAGKKSLDLSFSEGIIAVSYLGVRLDKETGYPLILDHPSVITAIGYYLKWKLAEHHHWNGRQGFGALALDSERKWLKYVGQANNSLKFDNTWDEIQNSIDNNSSFFKKGKFNKFFRNNKMR